VTNKNNPFVLPEVQQPCTEKHNPGLPLDYGFWKGERRFACSVCGHACFKSGEPLRQQAESVPDDTGKP